MLLVFAMTTLVVLAFAIPLAVLVSDNVYHRAISDLQDTTNRTALYLSRNDLTDSQLAEYLDGFGPTLCAAVISPNRQVIGCTPAGRTWSEIPALQGFEPDRERAVGPDPGSGPPNGQQPIAWNSGRVARAALGVAGATDDNAQLSTLVIYESDAHLRDGVGKWWLLLGGASAGLILLGLAGAEIVTRRMVRPLTDTAETAHRISAGDITARAPTSGPREIAEVGSALNRLADRIDELIANERETVADMSHRMRTPMTVLRLEAESLRNPDEARRMSDQVTALERTLTAVIRAARRPQREGRMAACDASQVLAERVRFWAPLAEDQGRPMTVDQPGAPVQVRASAEDLAAAVDALIENVMAHTEDGVAFSIALRPRGERAEIRIADDGPGFDAEAVSRGRSDRGSSGLGLDIVRQCAQAAGGQLDIARGAAGGAVVTLSLARV